MPKASLTLATLHRIHTQLEDLRGRLERMPMAVRAKRAGVTKLEEELAEARELVKQTRLSADRKQLDLKAAEAKIGDWQAQLNTAASNKEYQTLQEQIAASEMATSVQADEVLEMLERIDELEEEVGRAEQRLADGEAEYKRYIAGAEDQAATAKAEIARLESDLQTTEGELSGDHSGEYRRIVAAKGADAMAAAEDGVCASCGQTLTLNTQNNLALDKPCHCNSCGALLYLPE